MLYVCLCFFLYIETMVMVSKLSTENETVPKRTSKATPIHSTVVAHKPGCEDRLTRHKTAKSTHELLPPAATSRSGKPQPAACTCHTACPEHGAHACMIMFFCCFLFSSAFIVGLVPRRCLRVFLGGGIAFSKIQCCKYCCFGLRPQS